MSLVQRSFLDAPTVAVIDRPPAQRHSATSVAAAEAITPHLNRLEKKVYDAMKAAKDGLTDQEGVAVTGLSENCYRPRRVKLVEKGCVFDSGTERPTTSGRMATVWRVR